MRIRFEEVKLKATKRWKENGKTRQKTETFFQTISPFNKGADGMPKTREQILDELRKEKTAWLATDEEKP